MQLSLLISIIEEPNKKIIILFSLSICQVTYHHTKPKQTKVYFIMKIYRQGKYCNNLATRVIPYFIVSKSSVGKTILKTVLPHFSKDPVAQIPMTSQFMVNPKFLFQTCLNYTLLGCSLCTDKFLIKYYGFKIKGKQDIA